MDTIIAEDTRVTQKLIQLLSEKVSSSEKEQLLSKPYISLDKYSEAKKAQTIVKKCCEGQSVALMTDAGTPCISDPGYILVSMMHDYGVNVVPVAGPCAIATLLSVAGMPVDQHLFIGFFPKKKDQVNHYIEVAKISQVPIVFFESPKRINDTLAFLKTRGDVIDVCVGKELTKKFETILKGSIDSVVEKVMQLPEKGEWVACVSFKPIDQQPFDKELLDVMLEQGLSQKQIQPIGKKLGWSKNKVYEYCLKKMNNV